MWRRDSAQAASRYAVVFHWCTSASTNRPHPSPHISWIRVGLWARISPRYIYKHLKHLFPVPALCHSLSAFSLYTSAFASVSKYFISSPPSVHHTLPPFSQSACMHLFRCFTIPLSLSLSLSIPTSSSCECGGLAVSKLCMHFDKEGTDENITVRDRRIGARDSCMCVNERGRGRRMEASQCDCDWSLSMCLHIHKVIHIMCCIVCLLTGCRWKEAEGAEKEARWASALNISKTLL